MRAKCNLDCFNCPYEDCINDTSMDNSIYCARWYEKNREKKLEYQREYNKRHYKEQKQLKEQRKLDKLKEVPVEIKLLKFSELDVLLSV